MKRRNIKIRDYDAYNEGMLHCEAQKASALGNSIVIVVNPLLYTRHSPILSLYFSWRQKLSETSTVSQTGRSSLANSKHVSFTSRVLFFLNNLDIICRKLKGSFLRISGYCSSTTSV